MEQDRTAVQRHLLKEQFIQAEFKEKHVIYREGERHLQCCHVIECTKLTPQK